MTIQQDIYAELEKLLQPASLPAPWDHLEVPPDYRAPLREIRATAKSLREKFSDDDLVSSRVLTRQPGVGGAAPRLGIHPYLVVGNLLLLRHHFDEPPYDFVSAAGCVSGLPPVLAALHDATTQRLVEISGETLFATFRIQDAAILQALGYPAMPAAGLAKIKGPTLAQLCSALDVRSLSGASWDEYDFGADDDDDVDPASESSPSPSVPLPPPTCHSSPHQEQPSAGDPLPPQDPPAPAPQPDTPRRQNKALRNIGLCLVAWNPAQLSLVEPEHLAGIDAYLRQLATQLDLLMDEIYVWRPEPSLAEKLRSAFSYELLPLIRSLIESSYSQSVRCLILRDPASISSPPSLRELYDELRRGDGDGFDDHVARVRGMRQFSEQQITGPLLDAAEAQTDPALKAHAVAKAFHLGQQLDLLSRLAVPDSPQHRAGGGALRPEDIELLQSKQKLAMDLLDSVDPEVKSASRSRQRPSRRE